MTQYIVRRVILLIPTVFLLGIFIFAVMRVLPGDPARAILGEDARPQDVIALREAMGLNAPIYIQFRNWAWDMARFKVDSLASYRSLGFGLKAALPFTVSIAAVTILITVVVGIPLGVVSAIHQNSWIDNVCRVIAISGLSMPTFWFAILVIFAMVMLLNWIPPFEYVNPLKDPLGALRQLIVPAAVLSYHQLATVARLTRSSMLEVLREDYIRTAYAKGLHRWVVLQRHALRNALIPVLTMVGIHFAYMLNGVLVVEKVFNMRGVGFLMIDSVQARDYPIVEALIMCTASLIVCVNLVVDVLYGYIDPRIRYG